MIRAFAFDLGNTLSNDTELYDRACLAFGSWLVDAGHTDDAAVFTATFDRVNRQTTLPFTSHTYGEVEMFRATFEELGLTGLEPGEALERYRAFVCRHMVLDEEIRKALAWIRAQGVRLALLSNERSARAEAWFEVTGVRGLFDVVFVSEAAGVEKPDTRFFSEALDRIGTGPHETVMFGDNPIADGACRNLGIPFVHVTAFCSDRWYFEKGGEHSPDYVLPRITPESVRRCLSHFDPARRHSGSDGERV